VQPVPRSAPSSLARKRRRQPLQYFDVFVDDTLSTDVETNSNCPVRTYQSDNVVTRFAIAKPLYKGQSIDHANGIPTVNEYRSDSRYYANVMDCVVRANLSLWYAPLTLIIFIIRLTVKTTE
jgi:hypothetical protein